MKIILAGGTGHIGLKLTEYFLEQGHEIVVLSRGHAKSKARVAIWDGVHLGEWKNEIDGSDIVINLAGRTVDCRYTKENLRQMMDSRVFSTRVIGQAIAQAEKPPKLWLQMSTATVYAHSYDQANDEFTGLIGGSEPRVPAYWSYSVDIAKHWEKELNDANTPATRKVALRSSMVMGLHPESVFGVLSKMTKLGLGGSIAGGRQYVSWIHENDFVRALEFIIRQTELVGAINICSPNPVPQKEFMRILRNVYGIFMGLPTTKWMAEIGAFFIRTDTELILKSRRVVPGRLLKEGFQFEFPNWELAGQDLAKASAK